MESTDTLGLEMLNIEKPQLSTKAAKRARAKARKEKNEDTIRLQTEEHFREIEEIRNSKEWCPPATPSYDRLPVPPSGSSGDTWNRLTSLDLGDLAHHGAPIMPRYKAPRNPVSATDLLPGQGFTPINKPRPMVDIPEYQAMVARRAEKKSSRGPSETKIKTAKAAPGQRRSVSVEAHHGLSTQRTKKSCRHTNAQTTPNTTHPLNTSTPNPPQPPDPTPQKPKTKKSHKRSPTPFSHNDPIIPLPAPSPTHSYLSLTLHPPSLLPHPQPLLLILDLNGTLLYRSSHKTSYTPRLHLQPFLTYLLANHTVLIWSSARPKNVEGMCKRLFTPQQRRQLVGEWGRDTLGLSKGDYNRRVQVYKRLDRVWDDASIQRRRPYHGSEGGRWDQHNTLLIDDSVLKASAQPYNHIEVPEFVKGGDCGIGVGKDGSGGCSVLEQVVGYLEEARRWSDVSAFVRERKFGVGRGWGWDFGEDQKGKGGGTDVEVEVEGSEDVERSDDDGDTDEGGIRL
ncbi:hypothetical protein ACLMJK_009203 [Lecanora helva]